MTSYAVELIAPTDCDVEGIDPGETATIQVEADEYVLAAARQQGIWLPADCQQGWCTTCAAELLAGEVDQSDARRYYDVDRQADMILPCTARPRSDLRLRICRMDELNDLRAANSLPPGRSR
ncbi:2Fe-2S iron-sulfur cluster-binding protein [Halovivax limisalsi]|uniref:2Fe-2S iron-sulfur cluster-binding protein n=1 Tax=Halovivax limisalsi TaxID=1453760 RepID=UPI001FFD083B|nr:2Fe-2S iron-sulfur cluster-binding protein [Halovivax limisalsi]